MLLDRLWPGAAEAVRRHQVLGDAALALGLAILSIGMSLIDHAARRPTATDLLAAALSLLAITVRRRFNRIALAGCATAAIAFLTLDHRQQPMLTAATTALLYTYATRADRRAAWLTAGGVATPLVLAGCLTGVAGGDNLGMLAWVGLGTAVGDARRIQRAYVAEVEERARRAEQSREDEARLRVAQERMRIARDLHDVVAHHIAVVRVQASGAKHVLARRPEAVAPALDNIIRASDSVLQEMTSVVGLLRGSPHRPDGAAGIEPPRGLARLPELIAALTSAGLRIEHRQVGAARDLPLITDLAAYLITREALTNAQKYGDGTARLAVTYGRETVTVDVTNTIGGRDRDHGAGYGIVGMRERAAANGGSFAAGRSGPDRFAVHVDLPVPADRATR